MGSMVILVDDKPVTIRVTENGEIIYVASKDGEGSAEDIEEGEIRDDESMEEDDEGSSNGSMPSEFYSDSGEEEEGTDCLQQTENDEDVSSKEATEQHESQDSYIKDSFENTNGNKVGETNEAWGKVSSHAKSVHGVEQTMKIGGADSDNVRPNPKEMMGEAGLKSPFRVEGNLGDDMNDLSPNKEKAFLRVISPKLKELLTPKQRITEGEKEETRQRKMKGSRTVYGSPPITRSKRKEVREKDSERSQSQEKKEIYLTERGMEEIGVRCGFRMKEKGCIARRQFEKVGDCTEQS